MGDVRGGILRRALALARPGVRSPRETHLRLLLTRHGLPEPGVNEDIFSARGEFVAEIDLTFEAWRVAVEYDGRVHAEDPRQFARDADRWAAIRDAGWDHVRILSHHLRGDGAPAASLVRAALLRAGWRPVSDSLSQLWLVEGVATGHKWDKHRLEWDMLQPLRPRSGGIPRARCVAQGGLAPRSVTPCPSYGWLRGS